MCTVFSRRSRNECKRSTFFSAFKPPTVISVHIFTSSPVSRGYSKLSVICCPSLRIIADIFAPRFTHASCYHAINTQNNHKQQANSSYVLELPCPCNSSADPPPRGLSRGRRPIALNAQGVIDRSSASKRDEWGHVLLCSWRGGGPARTDAHVSLTTSLRLLPTR